MKARLIAVAAAGVLALAGCSGGESPAVRDTPAAVTTVTTPPPASSTPEVDGHQVLTTAIVLEGFAKAKLPARNQRDNSKNCESGLGCIQMVTTDDVTIYTFADPSAQQAIAAAFGEDAFSSGNVVLQYAAAHTPVTMRPKYERVLAGLK